MTNKHSIWQAAEGIVDADFIWIVEGPWLDAEYEDTLDEALEHLQLCCEAIVDTSLDDMKNEDPYRYERYENIEWLECRDDIELLETLLDNIEQDHRWYNDIVELLFMNTLAGV
jgi:hypothetical protein